MNHPSSTPSGSSDAPRTDQGHDPGPNLITNPLDKPGAHDNLIKNPLDSQESGRDSQREETRQAHDPGPGLIANPLDKPGARDNLIRNPLDQD